MVKPVFWTHEAEKTFNTIIVYLQEKWSEKEVSNFLYLTENVIELISRYPAIFRKTNETGMREALITKHQLIIYQEYEERIDLLVFWDTRKDPNEKPVNL